MGQNHSHFKKRKKKKKSFTVCCTQTIKKIVVLAGFKISLLAKLGKYVEFRKQNPTVWSFLFALVHILEKKLDGIQANDLTLEQD